MLLPGETGVSLPCLDKREVTAMAAQSQRIDGWPTILFATRSRTARVMSPMGGTGGGGRGIGAGRGNAVGLGYRGHQRRSGLGCAERGNPVEVRALPGKPTARKAQLLLAAGQDGPTSQCRQAERPQETGAGAAF